MVVSEHAIFNNFISMIMECLIVLDSCLYSMADNMNNLLVVDCLRSLLQGFRNIGHDELDWMLSVKYAHPKLIVSCNVNIIFMLVSFLASGVDFLLGNL